MLYDRDFYISDYLNYNEFNDFIWYCIVTTLLKAEEINIDTSTYPFFQYRDWNDMTKYNSENHNYFKVGDFIFVETLKSIEDSIKKLSYEFFRPPSYIQNKEWNTNISENGYLDIPSSFGAEDMNRIIRDSKLLYEYIDKWYNGDIRFSIYNMYSSENWEELSNLEWE